MNAATMAAEERRRCPARWLVAVFCLLLFVPQPGHAKNGAFRSTLHGDPVKGPQRKRGAQPGSCIQCHDQHRVEGSLQHRGAGLFAPNDNTLCFSCHTAPSDDAVYPGEALWSRSSHAQSPKMVRGGRDPRRQDDVNKCINCHEPHGNRDAAGVIPVLLEEREPSICLTCHDGSRGADVASQMTKAAVHGRFARGTHSGREGNDAGAYQHSNRHASCSDCHNSHAAAADTIPPQPPTASTRLAGVSHLAVVNGQAGSVPTYRWRSGEDLAAPNEYEICFKCHSSWVKLPPGSPDLALLTNPANASFHPIQGPGRNRRIDPAAFANGASETDLIRCTDCHGSDDPFVRGLHGSSNPGLLRKPSPVATSARASSEGDLCFSCHAFAVYADASSPEDVLRASRFNGPAAIGHAYHTGSQRIPCFSCHETHGSPNVPNLIALRRMPGIVAFTQTPAGGTCVTTCHAPQTYRTNYAR